MRRVNQDENPGASGGRHPAPRAKRMLVQRDSRTALRRSQLRVWRDEAPPQQEPPAHRVPGPSAAAEVFHSLSRSPGNPWVFPGSKSGTQMNNLNNSWDRSRKLAGLHGVRPHDLRHGYTTRHPSELMSSYSPSSATPPPGGRGAIVRGLNEPGQRTYVSWSRGKGRSMP